MSAVMDEEIKRSSEQMLPRRRQCHTSSGMISMELTFGDAEETGCCRFRRHRG